MNEKEKKEILNKAKIFFRDTIVPRHIINTEKLTSLSKFNYNPFLLKYVSTFTFGECTPKTIAKTLLFPRVMGTSITTTFGNNLQKFCNDILEGYASTTSGIDIEFIDYVDKRKKYCQIKSGPSTINRDDVDTIKNHFRSLGRLAKTNGNNELNPSLDCIIGIFYGNEEDLSGNYKEVKKDYPVYIGQEFWYRLTGDEEFYIELIDSFEEVAEEFSFKDDLDVIINKLALEIEEKFF